jgi:DNA-directed RNA polymerase II subunit RPB1
MLCSVPPGCLCKKTLGTAGGGLVHTVWNELGPDVTRYTINNIQFTVNYWLLQVGSSGYRCGLQA